MSTVVPSYKKSKDYSNCHMSEKHELPSDSDEDDEDYVPEEQDSVSEVESEGDVEASPNEDDNKCLTDINVRKRRKRCKNMRSKISKRKHKYEKPVAHDKEERAEDATKEKNFDEEEEKKKADSLWADFMKDTATVLKPRSDHSTANSSSEKSNNFVTKSKVEEKVKITKILEFAGEKVEVVEEVPADCTEARLTGSTIENNAKKANGSSLDEKRESKDKGTRKVGLSGISSILGQIGKKSKISTLEKSKLDWDRFKKQENIEEEINTHNKGKDGYLEKQDFLQRADLRQFEIEKQLRSSSRSTR